MKSFGYNLGFRVYEYMYKLMQKLMSRVDIPTHILVAKNGFSHYQFCESDKHERILKID